MHVIVVGGGIAGLGAAFRLRQAGTQVTVIDRNPDAGGRCRTHHWQGAWRVRGAFAFISAETNLIELARALGIYDALPRIDLTEGHEQVLLHKRKRLARQRAFTLTDILASPVIPARQKVKLAAVLPKLIAQAARHDPRDPTTAIDHDEVGACAYFRELAPAFVDYVLEPTMQMFCGYGEDDYSLAWLLWVMGGFAWAEGWWSFADRGVGQLTHTLGQRLVQEGCDVRLSTTATAIHVRPDGVTVDTERDGHHGSLHGDRVVVAVPGSLVADLMPDLDDERRAFFAGVHYVGHHIVHYVLDGTPAGLPESRLLPTADGFERVANLHFRPMAGGRTIASGEIKGRRCAETSGWSDDAILDDAWIDFVAVAPQAGTVAFVDRHLQRNDIALCRRAAGYTTRLARFRALPPLPHVAFAGDYLINSTVGQAHWSGLQAAEAILRST